MFWFRAFPALLLGLLTLGFTLSPIAAAGANATRVRWLLPSDSIQPGETLMAGIELTHSPGWHTYWRHGGDSGKPTTLDWNLPPGLSAGAIRWPAPERHEEDSFITYVHHDVAVLLVPLTLDAQALPGTLDFSVEVKWLECQSQCVPGRSTLRGQLIVGGKPSRRADAAALTAAEEKLPSKGAPDSVTATWDAPPGAEERALVIRWKLPGATGTPDFFPDGSNAYEIGTATDRLAPSGGWVTLRKKVKKLDGDWPVRLTGLLAVLADGGKPSHAQEVEVPISAPIQVSPTTDTTTKAAAGAAESMGSSTGEAGSSVAELTLGKALLFGLLGGLILNIMPCVLPVIALKILGFVRQGGSQPAEVRKLGIVYGLGVWFSFLVLAGAVIAVKQAAAAASWGMQFGNPVFLVVMTTLVTLVALSLFGIYEINVTGRALDAAGELTTREGSAGAFFNGMLAVALATPCTAPFLAPALGYAFAASAGTILLIFSAVAVGLASPYVVLSFQPGLLKFLPRPGAWMERFKIAMGFPMLATALWLYTLASRHFGGAGPLWLGLFLLGVSLSAWIWGEFVQRGRRNQAVSMVLAIVVVGISYIIALERELNWRNPARDDQAGGARELSRAGGIAWTAWSTAAVAAARAQGHPVLVDFTAEWCLTCQLNERSSIEIPSVREKIASTGTVALKGDNTLLPPAIIAELQRFKRAGVPLVLVYPRDAAKDPIVLPELLTPSLVLSALAEAAK